MWEFSTRFRRSWLRAYSSLPIIRVRRHAVPVSGLARARASMSKHEICGLASRFDLSEVPIEDADGSNELTTYVRVIDLALSESDEIESVRPMMTISADDTPIEALIRMHSRAREHGAGHRRKRADDRSALCVPFAAAVAQRGSGRSQDPHLPRYRCRSRPTSNIPTT